MIDKLRRLVPHRLAVRMRQAADDAQAMLLAYWTLLTTVEPDSISPAEPRRRTFANAQCLAPLLKALGYRGTELDRVEAVPHLQDGMDITDLRAALVQLGYKTEAAAATPDGVDPRLLPCLHEDEDGNVVVLTGREEGIVLAVVNGDHRALKANEAARAGTAYFPRPLEAVPAVAREGWSWRLWRRFKPHVLQLFVLSGASNVLAIAVPLFVMIVYDRVIAAKALDSLPMLFVGVLLAIGFSLYLRILRGRLLGVIAARIDYLIGTTTFAKLLRLPLSYTASAPVSAQLARLREFQAVRDLFSGPAASAIVDFPFTLIAIAVIAAIAGPLALVPLAACVVFAAAGYAGARWVQSREDAQSASATALFNHVNDTTLHHESLQREGAEATWLYRLRLKSAEAAHEAEELQGRVATVEALSQFLNSAAAIAVLVTGTFMVLEKSLTVGALIATMALTWRILSPAQQLFETLGRFGRLKASIQALDQTQRLPDEFERRVPNLTRAPRRGTVMLNRVSLRYGNNLQLAVANFGLTIPAGRTVAITGPSGAGKSSVLRLIEGLHPLQAGTVSIDGIDTRQLSSKLLRRTIASVPQKVDMFYGTVAQNLRMGDPLASEEMLRAAAHDVGILEAIENLPNGFETRIGDSTTLTFSPGFLRQLSIVRALVRPSSVLLLDEPESMLNEEWSASVQHLLEKLRGRRTVIFTSHRPSYIRVADFAVYMRGGQIEYGGAPDGAIERLFGQPKTGKAA
jgi:ATP-binding cassette, subfamily C, bacterial LapB